MSFPPSAPFRSPNRCQLSISVLLARGVRCFLCSHCAVSSSVERTVVVGSVGREPGQSVRTSGEVVAEAGCKRDAYSARG